MGDSASINSTLKEKKEKGSIVRAGIDLVVVMDLKMDCNSCVAVLNTRIPF